MNKIFVVLLFFTGFCFAQKTEKDLIKETVELLFTGMKNADTAVIKSAFTDTPVLQTVIKNNAVKSEKLESFLSSFSRLSKNDADERIVFEAIHTDGTIASVFTPYEFYFKGNFSHCGVNSFQLIKQNKIWKIQYLIDTRRKNCKNN